MNRENTSDGRTVGGPAFSFFGRSLVVSIVTFVGMAGTGMAGEFVLNPAQPSMDRLMYPYAFDGGTRPMAYTFGSFDPRFDTRDGQLLLGWNTASLVPTNLPASRYLLKLSLIHI